MNILGVKIDNLNRKELLQKIESFLDEPKFHQIVTVNPEFILEAQKNREFRNVLNSAHLNIADGFGIKCAFWKNLKNLKCRLAGVDLLSEILKMAGDRGLRVFLACCKDGLTSFEEAREAILKKYPSLRIEGADIEIDRGAQSPIRDPVSKIIGGDIMICNFGHSYQELFINSSKNDTIRLAIGVGGALDFLARKVKRAPKFIRVIGLEWLWRLIQEPHYRWKRVFRAVIIFPIRIIINK